MISGPYRSGTNDNPELIKKNLANLEHYAYQVFLRGHTPIIGEWLALPLMRMAGSKETGDDIYTSISYPIAHRILRSCDGVLRIPGKSTGADKDLEVAAGLGLKLFTHLDQVPTVNE